MTFLRSLFATSTVLFLGVSFTDAYLNELRSEVLAMLDHRSDDAAGRLRGAQRRQAAPAALPRPTTRASGVIGFDTAGGTDWSGFEQRPARASTTPPTRGPCWAGRSPGGACSGSTASRTTRRTARSCSTDAADGHRRQPPGSTRSAASRRPPTLLRSAPRRPRHRRPAPGGGAADHDARRGPARAGRRLRPRRRTATPTASLALSLGRDRQRSSEWADLFREIERVLG